METFSALLALCAGNSPVSGEFPSQRPVTRSFDVFFDLRPNKRLSKNREAGDLRRHRAHYDVNVMSNPGRHLFRQWRVAWKAIIRTNAGKLSTEPRGETLGF